MERIGHYIGGKHVPGESGRRGPVFDPATGEQTHEVDFADPAELDKAVQAATEALPAWRATSLSKRAEIMFRIRELLDARTRELVRRDRLRPVGRRTAGDRRAGETRRHLRLDRRREPLGMGQGEPRHAELVDPDSHGTRVLVSPSHSSPAASTCVSGRSSFASSRGAS